jgi:hypothetical protein
LLEVVLALALFVAAAAVISGGLHAAVESVDRLRFQAHALDRAVSVLSELQMGVRPLQTTGPEPFEPPFEEWTCEIQTAPLESGLTSDRPLKQVEVVIRHETGAVVQRLALWLPDAPLVSASESSTSLDNDETP